MANTPKPSTPQPAYSLLMAAVGALSIALAVYMAARFAGVVRVPLIYHALVFGAFFGVYMVMPGGFEKHFNVPTNSENRKMSVADVIYYTTVVHSTAGFGDIYPLTNYARAAVSLHLGLAFMATLVPFLQSSG